MKEEGGGSEIFSTTKEGAPKKIEPLARGAAKISSFDFQYLHLPPPLVILNELSLTTQKYKKIKSVSFWLDCENSDLENSYSRMGLGGGDFGEFSLV